MTETAFARVFRRLGLRQPAPNFRVVFRPFAGIRSTISLRDSQARVSISDLMTAAPPIVFEALAEILLARVFRRQPSREARDCFSAFVSAPAMRRRIEAVRRERGMKRLLPPEGRCYNLREIFDLLNAKFFGGELPRPHLGWSYRRSRFLLGHYDAAHHSITISRWFDSPSVPRYLVEYLVYHEMLHMRFPVGRQGHRRVVHSPMFREEEKKFPNYARARRRLKQISGHATEEL